MNARTEILNPSTLPAARAFRSGLAKVLGALAVIGESFLEGQDRARAAQQRHRFVEE